MNRHWGLSLLIALGLTAAGCQASVQAGGAASDGKRRIMDITPGYLHQRTPLFIGNRHLVEEAEVFIDKYAQE